MLGEESGNGLSEPSVGTGFEAKPGRVGFGGIDPPSGEALCCPCRSGLEKGSSGKLEDKRTISAGMIILNATIQQVEHK